MGDRAHAAGALHDRQRCAEGAALDQLLETAMDEAQPSVEVEDALADRREAEVAGLDDAGMDRADRELVDAFAVDLKRDEMAIGLGRPDIAWDVLAEWVVAARPALVEDKPAWIWMTDRHDPEQVLRLTLVPVGRWHERADRRVRRLAERQRDPQPGETAVRSGHDRFDRQTLAADRALVETDDHDEAAPVVDQIRDALAKCSGVDPLESVVPGGGSRQARGHRDRGLSHGHPRGRARPVRAPS